MANKLHVEKGKLTSRLFILPSFNKEIMKILQVLLCSVNLTNLLLNFTKKNLYIYIYITLLTTPGIPGTAFFLVAKFRQKVE
jgi:hypothetical protein